MQPTHKLYQTNGLDVEVYDARFGNGEPLLEGDIRFYTEHAQKQTKNGGRVLELGCGTGRITWQLAEEGIPVVGLDLSETMLNVAREKAVAYEPEVVKNVAWVQGNMSKFQLNEKFPMIFIPCRSFQCLVTPAEQERCLVTIANHLTEDGILILDLFDPRFENNTTDWTQTMAYRSIVRHPQSGNLVRVEFAGRNCDHYKQTLHEFWCYTELDKNGQALRSEHTEMVMRWNTRQEMRYLFRMTGFDVVREFSDFKKSEPMYGKEQVWVLKKSRKN